MVEIGLALARDWHHSRETNHGSALPPRTIDRSDLLRSDTVKLPPRGGSRTTKDPREKPVSPAAARTAAVVRCPWADREPEITYHDTEWGVPLHDDRRLFELLTLEGAQAGLSWETILKKRDGYRAAFENFDPAAVARFDAARVDALVANPAIVRHRGKIAATVTNAAAFLRVQAEAGSFATYLWRFVAGKPVVTRLGAEQALPARTALSDAISTDLRKRGFTFVGSTIVYAFLQATGVVDDHYAACFRAVADPFVAGRSG